MALKVLIVDPDYPRDSHLYGDVFVHTRLKAYPESWQLNVVGYNPLLTEDYSYVWDGIEVYLSPEIGIIKKEILSTRADVIVIHFIQQELMDTLMMVAKPLLIFFHGIEAASWKRRMFDYYSPGAIPYLIKAIRTNRKQLRELKKFIEAANRREEIHFVFVSKWFQDACEKDMNVNIRNKHVIHNSVDTVRFKYQQKSPDKQKKILAIRSFDSRKYANDLLVEAILALSKRPYFDDLSFSIYGKGYLFEKLTDKIKKFKNVSLHNYYIPNELIPAVHAEYGIYLSFTRLDAQGVSMCEAMSSGLVTLASGVTAIPEFVTDGYSGFLINNNKQLVACMDKLYNSPDLFEKISKQGSESIAEQCSYAITIPQEVNLIAKLANQ